MQIFCLHFPSCILIYILKHQDSYQPISKQNIYGINKYYFLILGLAKTNFKCLMTLNEKRIIKNTEEYYDYI